jgi:hypothetical protein
MMMRSISTLATLASLTVLLYAEPVGAQQTAATPATNIVASGAAASVAPLVAVPAAQAPADTTLTAILPPAGEPASAVAAAPAAVAPA